MRRIGAGVYFFKTRIILSPVNNLNFIPCQGMTNQKRARILKALVMCPTTDLCQSSSVKQTICCASDQNNFQKSVLGVMWSQIVSTIKDMDIGCKMSTNDSTKWRVIKICLIKLQ